MAARPTRRYSVKEKGFYKCLNMDDKRERLEDVEVLSEKNSDGVYEVERLVEKKMKKVRLCGPRPPYLPIILKPGSFLLSCSVEKLSQRRSFMGSCIRHYI